MDDDVVGRFTVEKETVELLGEGEQLRVFGFVFLVLAVAVHGSALGRRWQGREGRRVERDGDGSAGRGAHVYQQDDARMHTENEVKKELIKDVGRALSWLKML